VAGRFLEVYANKTFAIIRANESGHLMALIEMYQLSLIVLHKLLFLGAFAKQAKDDY